MSIIRDVIASEIEQLVRQGSDIQMLDQCTDWICQYTVIGPCGEYQLHSYKEAYQCVLGLVFDSKPID